MQPKIAILILAAGNSSRMADVKQLLPWNDTFLLNHTINNAAQLNHSKTHVVLGANCEQIKSAINRANIEIIYNKEWKKGLGSSIAFGVKHIKSKKQFDCVLTILADQPLIDTDYLSELVNLFEIKKNQIIASSYGNKKVGVPALFDGIYFDELSTLNEDKGAKQILKKHNTFVKTLNAENLITDIDTIEDYEQLYKANHQL
jgi:molybdenum cofactor cytidylyltransferase